MSEPSRRRVTYGQLEQLWDCLNINRVLATGFNKTAQAREFSRRMWEELAIKLNSHGDGAVKDWKGWCKYWNDYKSKLKKIAAAITKSHQTTGGGQPTIRPMTDLEKKFVQLLGSDFGLGLPGVRVEPFDEDIDVQTGSESILAGVELFSIPLDGTGPGPSTSHCTPVCVAPQHTPPNPFISSPHNTPVCYIANPPLTPPNRPVSSATAPQPAITPRRSPRRRLILSNPPAPSPSQRRRRRVPYEPYPMVLSRRDIMSETQKQTKIQEEKLKVFKAILEEIRELKQMCIQRFNLNPGDGV